MSDQSGLINNSAPNPQVAIEGMPSPSGSASAAGTGNDGGMIEGMFKASSHPRVLFFHLFFRTAAVIVYFFGGILTSSSTILAIIVLLLSAFDFWTVKNISGRKLVGLRWWNDTNADGKGLWVFESKQRDLVNKTDSNVFWWSMYIFIVIWVVFLVVSIIRLSFLWTVIDIVSITLQGANLAGYIRCDRDAKSKFEGALSRGIMAGLMQNTFGSWVR